MQESRDGIVQAYLEQALRKEQPTVPTQQELEEIARGLGLSGDDLKQVRRYARECVKRAEEFNKFGNTREAIEQYEQAVALMPQNIEAMMELVVLYQSQYHLVHGSEREEMRRKGLALTGRLLELDATNFAAQTALMLLPSDEKVSTDARRRTIGWILFACALVIVPGSIVLSSNTDTPEFMLVALGAVVIAWGVFAFTEQSPR